MVEVEIRDARLEDIKELVDDLRPEDKAEADALGNDTYENLHMAYSHAMYCKSFLIDGEVAAMSGVTGNLFGDVGAPFFITSNRVYKISPIKFARIYMEQTEAFKSMFPKLENHADAAYKGAIRLLKIAGYTLEGPVEFGPKKSLFYKFSMVGY